MWPPQWLTPTPPNLLEAGQGNLVIDFAEAFGVITKDSIAGKQGSPLVLRPWQQDLIRHIFAGDGESLQHRVSLVGVPRKNGKSALGSTLALYSLLLGPRGGEVYSVAAEMNQARIVFADAKRMIEASPELADMVKLYRDAIEVPTTGSVYRVLSAEAYSKEGLSPTFVMFDELHAQPDRTLFDVMSLAQGARGDLATMVAITTSGVKSDSTGNDSIAYSLYQYGQRVAAGEIDDPTFFMAWWEGKKEADHRDPKTWRDANPGFDDIVAPSDFESAVKRTPEAEFRTKRLNQWVNAKTAWLPAGAWDALSDTFEMSPDDEYVLGFDGSWKNDSTAVVAVILPKEEGEPYRAIKVAAWEKDFALDDDSWVVDKKLVAKTVMDFVDKYPNIKEMACDPSYWEDEMFQWNDYGIPVVEYRNTVQRTVPATSKLFEAIMSKKLRHNGDAAIARHLENCILKIDSQRGGRITKDFRNPKLKIDLAIALLMAYDRASSRLEEQVIPQFFV